GVEFRVSIPANENATAPSAAMDADGDFVVAWQRGTNNYYGVFNDVYAQRYNAAGAAQGTEVRVNVATGNASAPFAAMNGDGDFVVTWQGAGISAQRFNAAGVRQGVALRANSYPASGQDHASAAMAANGDFVIAWSNVGQDGSGSGV